MERVTTPLQGDAVQAFCDLGLLRPIFPPKSIQGDAQACLRRAHRYEWQRTSRDPQQRRGPDTPVIESVREEIPVAVPPQVFLYRLETNLERPTTTIQDTIVLEHAYRSKAIRWSQSYFPRSVSLSTITFFGASRIAYKNRSVMSFR